jgi:glycosyltransferase involved in cell wall biosynthesis
LCEALAETGESIRLWTISGAHSEDGFHETYRADYSKVPGLKQLRVSGGLRNALAHADADAIFHVHGLWRMANIYPGRAALQSGRPLVLSPRGMLGGAALRFSAGRKKLFWILAQRKAAGAASCIHATSLQEYEDVRAFGLTAPVAIIPNGIDVPASRPGKIAFDTQRKLLYLGRLHPKKDIESLLEAWSIIRDRHPDWCLDVVGPVDSPYARTLEAKFAGPDRRVNFRGALYGDAKWAAYANADLFVLPTLNENFAMTVAEALAHGTPVISTKGAPWAGLQDHGCGWWVERGVASLSCAMDEAMRASRADLAGMGQAGRAWMIEEFSWQSVAASMRSVYAWLAGDAGPPAMVRMD